MIQIIHINHLIHYLIHQLNKVKEKFSAIKKNVSNKILNKCNKCINPPFELTGNNGGNLRIITVLIEKEVI